MRSSFPDRLHAAGRFPAVSVYLEAQDIPTVSRVTVMGTMPSAAGQHPVLGLKPTTPVMLAGIRQEPPEGTNKSPIQGLGSLNLHQVLEKVLVIVWTLRADAYLVWTAAGQTCVGAESCSCHAHGHHRSCPPTASCTHQSRPITQAHMKGFQNAMFTGCTTIQMH